MVGSCMRAARSSVALLNALGGGSGVPVTGLRDAAAALLHAAGPVLPWTHASPVHSTQGAYFSPQRHSMAAAAAGAPSTGGLHIHLPWKRPEPTHKGVLIDAAGTLLSPSEPAAMVYARYAHKHGFEIKHNDVLGRYRRAYNAPWGGSTIRYVGDGRPFWRHIVREATGIASQEVFEDIYNYYQSAHAWHVASGAVQALSRLRVAGVRLAVVSNFDTRLKPLLQELGIGHLFDAVVVSAEVGVEKPNPIIYETALQRLGLKPHEVLHVGDDRRNDVWGARDAGVSAWLWGDDVHSFDEVADRVLYGKLAAEYWEHVHDHEHEHQPQQDHGQ